MRIAAVLVALAIPCWPAGAAYAQTTAEGFTYHVVDHERTPGQITAMLQPFVDAWKGETADGSHIQAWSTRLTEVLHAGGYPIGQVLVTAEDARRAEQSHVLQFTVYLGQIGRLDVDNSSRVKEARLKRTLEHALCDKGRGIGEGCVLESSRLERATQLVQDIPGVTLGGAPALDSQGVGTGQTHMTVQTVPVGQAVSYDAIADNQGTDATGLLRLGATVSANNILGEGDSYSAALYTTNKHMWSGTLGASGPIGYSGLRWSLAAGRALYSINSDVQVKAVADTVSTGLVYPFVRGLDANVYGAFDLLDTHTKTSYPDFGFDVQTHLYASRLTFSGNNGDRAQQLGLSQWQGSVALTVGDQSNDDAQDVGPQRAGRYAKLSADLMRRQNLTSSTNLFAVANVRGQLASKNLDYSEMLSLGGLNGVRAYRADEGSVDQGVIASLDLRWRWVLPKGGQILPGPFVDFALGQLNRDPWPGWQAGYPTVSNVTNRRVLAGYGLAIDWVSTNGFTTSVAWARRFPFAQDSWVAPGSARSRFWLSFTWKH
ncbi:ShlB/FhaC/HecB family hemolysin secretion/activation protein (plasmid) [Paraburkholderia sp. PREW-6R]|uniref:ShlB/FhaC/HecB family hemolysin secretion/activation protein n=1 Tax=Paraburkholderia sp. PREW-6R TaxID=3141544 RepID=UPI0031F527DA